MEVIQHGVERFRDGWTIIPLLLLMMTGLVGWFPGHNAARRGHERAAVVNGAGWAIALLGALVAATGVLSQVLGPVLVVSWLGVVIWSYGKRDEVVQAASAPARAFEVIPPAVAASASRQVTP